ncbi:MAG: zinc ribbon domain-containing protein [Lachnospiraceae bacterium]|nr:zinc ribbon domain-containing protein [Lachnospiraceae bacterium]
MALIKCPECGREISDKATLCIGCGFPIKEYLEDARMSVPSKEMCPYCGSENIDNNGYCDDCGMLIASHSNIAESQNKNEIEKLSENKREFQGIYRCTTFGGMQEVYCPRCGSEDCSHHQEQRVIPAQTKTRYTANLNPLRPFTLVNKKEKVVKYGKTITENKIICNKCGMIFQ